MVVTSLPVVVVTSDSDVVVTSLADGVSQGVWMIWSKRMVYVTTTVTPLTQFASSVMQSVVPSGPSWQAW